MKINALPPSGLDGTTASFRLRPIKYFLIILTPLLILLALTLWQFYRLERDAIVVEIKTIASQHLAKEQKQINREFQTIVSDLRVLAGQNEIRHYVDSNDSSILASVGQEFILHSKNKGTYDQIRLIAANGQEKVRVNFNHGSPALTAEKDLQNKGNRYYFQDSMQLPENSIFTSPLDLNLEHGKIEYPLKPMIRFGTPIFNSRGQKKGIILLNYQASQLLAKIAAEANNTFGELMLINADGYWLFSPNEGEAWGFMDPAGIKRVFQNSFPEAWQKMAAQETGSFFTANGFFNFQRIDPIKFLRKSPQQEASQNKLYPWLLISRVTPQQIKELTAQTNNHFIKLFTLLTQGAILSALLITWALLKRKTAEQDALIAREQKEEFILRRAEQDSALAELSGSLLSEISIEEVTESIIAKARMLTHSRFSFAGYIDNDNGNLVFPTISNDIAAKDKQDEEEIIFNQCAELWREVIDNHQTILTNTPKKALPANKLPSEKVTIQRFLSVPAMINDELVGIVALANSEQEYTERDLGAINRIATLFALAIQRQRTDESVHRLLLGTAAVTGEQFFATMAEQLAKCLGTKYVMVGEIMPDSATEVTGLAFWNDTALAEPVNYSTTDTPCEMVSQKGFCLYEDHVAEIFANDQMLQDMNVKFYAGIPLCNTSGDTIGILCAMHDAPLTKITHLNEIFHIFSNRTSGEILRQRAEKALALAKEAAESANKAKSRFLANISHELRTPLNAIIGFATVLQEQHFGPLNEKQLGYTKEIRDGGNHQLSIINDILDLAKIESGKMPFSTMPAQISILMTQSLAIIKDRAAQHAIAINVNIDPEIENLIIDIDERKIKLVFLNLLTNAVKFTPDNGSINVSMLRRQDTLLISICDTGIGIDAEDLSRIFEPFYQVKNEYRGKTPGTGLGLPLTKTLVEMHHGTLKVNSAGLKQGTCFTITLPIKESRIAAALLAAEK